MFRLILVLLIVTSASILPASAQQTPIVFLSNDQAYPCPNPDGAFYQGDVFPRYDAVSGNLILASQQGESTRVLERIDQNVRIITWSPDCHYLTGVVGEIRGIYKDSTDRAYVDWTDAAVRNVVIWDAVNGGRVTTFPRHSGNSLAIEVPSVIWSPDSNRALVLGGCPSVFMTCQTERITIDYLWLRETNTFVRIGGFSTVDDSTRYLESRALFNQHYWDFSRGWLWGDAFGGVVVYDIHTGNEVFFFQNVDTRTDSRFTFSPDGTRLIVYTVAREGAYDGGGITVYDIATQAQTVVNAGGFGAPLLSDPSHPPIALSSDNRYLIAGHEAIRVWDIQNLPEQVEDRLPIYRHGGPEANIWSIRFVDWGVIETTSEEGVQKWDLHTGVYIP